MKSYIKIITMLLFAEFSLGAHPFDYFNAHVGKKFVIGSNGAGGPGFFSDFFAALNNLLWCEKNGKTPVIHWGEESRYYQKEGYNGQTNVWRYYFEPVSELEPEPTDPESHSYIAPNADLVPGIFETACQYLLKGNRRQNIQAFIEKYVKVNSIVQEKIDDFYNAHMKGKTTIALHLRGTDKYKEIDPVNISEILAYANSYAKQYPSYQFLVCTDEEDILQEAIKSLDGKVIYYDSCRSKNGKPLHLSPGEYSRAKLGEEILIETMLMANSDMLIHTCSNVSYAALFFNSQLKNHLFLSDKRYH